MGNGLAKKITGFIICFAVLTMLLVLQTSVWADPTAAIASSFITLQNNPSGQLDSITISDPNLLPSDVIRVYKSTTDPNALAAFVSPDSNTQTFYIYDLGSTANVYISKQSLYLPESTRTAVTLSAATDPNYTSFSATNIASVVNSSIGTPDQVNVTGILSGDIIRVYTASSGGTPIGAGIASDVSTTVYINQLGTGSGTVYVTRQTPGNAETTTRYSKSYVKEPPKITNTVATKGTGATTSLEPNDMIIITFDINTCKPALDGNTINSFIRLYDPNGNRQSWGGTFDPATDTVSAPASIAAAWNTAGNQLTVTFTDINDIPNVTLALGNTIRLNASASLKDANSSTAASTAVSPVISGTFIPTPVMLSAVAANDGNNLGLDCNDTVTITFSGPTNEPNNLLTNINTWLKPTLVSDPNTSHVWTNASTISSAIACSWNTDANVLIVRFKSNTGATIKVGDKLTLKSDANLKDNTNATPASSCFIIITGTFTSPPAITSLVASNDANNFGSGVGDIGSI